jgi:hypothetical protein
VVAIWDVSNLVQAVLITMLVVLASAAVVAGGLMLMTRLEAALPSSTPRR